MTHLANKGEDRARILAGLFDAVSENVTSLIRPRYAPRDVVLVGGVARAARVRRRIGEWLQLREMHLHPGNTYDFAIEAIGAAVYALDFPSARRRLNTPDDLLRRREPSSLERTPALMKAMPRVHRMKAEALKDIGAERQVVLGFDIGSTGSKLVAVETTSAAAVWETYLNTGGRAGTSRAATARSLGTAHWQCGKSSCVWCNGLRPRSCGVAAPNLLQL